jgi:hypothetical protein
MFCDLWQEMCDVTYQPTELSNLLCIARLRPVHDAVGLLCVHLNSSHRDVMT